MACRISELVIDARDPARLASFWCEVLGLVELRIAAHDRVGPSLIPKAAKLHMHFDVNPPDRDQGAEVARLVGAGARPADIGQRGDEGSGRR